MRNFEIIKRGNNMFVQSINFYNPINELIDIANELHAFEYEGVVIFDLLLTNGNSSNRFLISSFINREFVIKSFRKTHISKDIRNEITLYYKNHKEYLSNSVLSTSTISEIINEIYLDK
jgi:hypothetical protein